MPQPVFERKEILNAESGRPALRIASIEIRCQRPCHLYTAPSLTDLPAGSRE
jgi:hypothetical protein